MQDIRVLEPHVIDHIAAGEVVERPASVVKELLENALDAGATTAEICLADGGLTEICITDDGHGMTPDNARRCVLRHATSKLRCADDLFRIATLGFRGEALSSIAAVSELCLTTRPRHALEGLTLRLRAGEVEAESLAGCPPGTSVAVRSLFFNTPARRKFMRAPATEQAHVVEAVTRVMLACRRAGVVVRSGNRRLVDIPPEARGAERVVAALGARVGTLHSLRSEVEGVRVEGFMSAPELDRGDAKGLWLFVNGRYVRDRLLQRAVVDTCRDLLQPGRYPTVVLHIDLPADQVDVNVHPQKLEVRFARGAAVYRAVACALAEAVAARPWAQGTRVDRSLAAGRRGAAAPEVRPGPPPASAPVDSGGEGHSGAVYLGTALERYLVGRDPEGLVLVDWPAMAAHQALAQLGAEAAGEGVRRVALLLPEVLEAQAPWGAWLETAWEDLTRYGFELEPVAPGRYALRAMPEALVGAPALETAVACVQAAFAASKHTAPSAAAEQHVLSTCAGCVRGLPTAEVAQAVLAELPPDAPGVLRLDAPALKRLITQGA